MNRQQFFNYLKISARDFVYFSVLYATLYTVWSLMFNGRMAFRLDAYDVCYAIVVALLILPLMAYGRYTCDQWLHKNSFN